MDIKVIDKDNFIDQLFSTQGARDYGAMYSSWLGGIVKEPELMMIPVDDHMVHRGDAVFEAFKFVENAFYDIKSHLDRLRASADFISLKVPFTDEEITSICRKLIEVSGLNDSIFRLYVSRGPGDFSPNPYNTEGSQLYIIATPLKHPDKEKYEKGCSLMRSDIPVKPGFYSKVKSCNYMQNVLMKKQSLDKGVDFAVNFNEEGFLCEGPTENILVVTKDGRLVAPKYEYTLKGTTLEIVLGLADSLKQNGDVTEVKNDHLTEEDLINAKEVMMVGTTLEVIPVVKYEEHTISDGMPGPVQKALRNLLQQDMKTSAINRTEV